MAYGSAELSSTVRALAAADNPLLIGENVVRDVNDLDWRQAGSFVAGADETDAAGPTSYAYDEQDDSTTYPDAAQNTWYMIADQSAANVATFDSIVILNHNLGTESATIAIEIANDNAFTVNLEELATDTPADDKRLVFLALYHTGSVARQYSDVRYWRFKITGTGVLPTIGEVIIGRRTQLKHTPMLGYDRNNLISNEGVFESDSGMVTSYVYHKMRRRIVASLLMSEDSYISGFETFFETYTDGGTLPFVWIDLPGTTPSNANWMKYEKPVLSGKSQGFTERVYQFAALEKGPNFLKLGT